MFVILPFAAAGPHRDRTRLWHTPVLSYRAREIHYLLQGHSHKVKASRVWQSAGQGVAPGDLECLLPLLVFLPFRAAGPDRDRTRPWHTPVLSHKAREIHYLLQGHSHKVKASRVWQSAGQGVAPGDLECLLPLLVFLPFRAAGPDRDRTRPWHTPVLSHTAREIRYLLQGH